MIAKYLNKDLVRNYLLSLLVLLFSTASFASSGEDLESSGSAFLHGEKTEFFSLQKFSIHAPNGKNGHSSTPIDKKEGEQDEKEDDTEDKENEEDVKEDNNSSHSDCPFSDVFHLDQLELESKLHAISDDSTPDKVPVYIRLCSLKIPSVS